MFSLSRRKVKGKAFLKVDNVEAAILALNHFDLGDLKFSWFSPYLIGCISWSSPPFLFLPWTSIPPQSYSTPGLYPVFADSQIQVSGWLSLVSSRQEAHK